MDFPKFFKSAAIVAMLLIELPNAPCMKGAGIHEFSLIIR
jgi:hypothetical protein